MFSWPIHERNEKIIQIQSRNGNHNSTSCKSSSSPSSYIGLWSCRNVVNQSFKNAMMRQSRTRFYRGGIRRVVDSGCLIHVLLLLFGKVGHLHSHLCRHDCDESPLSRSHLVVEQPFRHRLPTLSVCQTSLVEKRNVANACNRWPVCVTVTNLWLGGV